ncbi:MAG: diaminopimelate decarboxylase, partial [Chloroflexi bacterium]
MSPLPQLEGIAPDTATVGPGGHLLVGGCDVVDVALRYGTPIYLYDEATIRARARAFREAVGGYPARAAVQYAA